MEESTIDNVTNSSIDMVHQLVSKVKARREVGINYMKSWEWEQIYRDEGREEGIGALIEICRELNIPKEDVIDKIMSKFSISRERAGEYLEEYWKAENENF